MEKGFKVTGLDGSKELLKIAAVNCPGMYILCGDARSINIQEFFDAILEWWCLFHIPKEDHELMIARYARWLKPGGILEFTSGDKDFEATDNTMLNQELYFASLDPLIYEGALKNNGFELLLRESDQKEHLVWIARKKIGALSKAFCMDCLNLSKDGTCIYISNHCNNSRHAPCQSGCHSTDY